MTTATTYRARILRAQDRNDLLALETHTLAAEAEGYRVAVVPSRHTRGGWTLAVTPAPALITCPTSTTAPDGTAHTITGCGSTNVVRDDAEPNLYDCLNCGMFFDPTREA